MPRGWFQGSEGKGVFPAILPYPLFIGRRPSEAAIRISNSAGGDDAEATGLPQRQRVRPAPSRRGKRPLGTTRILIVEDEAILAEGMSMILCDAGYKVVGICADRISAINTADRLRPELVLMDIALAHDCDGIDVARDLQERLGVTVVFVTACCDSWTRERAAALGAAGYLTKPYSPTNLLDVVAAAQTPASPR
jgi:two-component system, response regulator PdtaR